MEFVMNPTRILSDALNQDYDDTAQESIERLFVETVEYSDRLIGIGEWQPPDLPYLEREGNEWLPERFSILLQEKIVTLEADEVQPTLDKISQAMMEGRTAIDVNGVTLEPTQELCQKLQHFCPAESKPEAAESKAKKEEPESTKQIRVLQAKENFDLLEYVRKKGRRAELEPTSQRPSLLKATLRSHQEEGLSWLKRAYACGLPGVLLADDMGLGKTIQVLSFLAWLRERGHSNGGPLLVVAPTSLLANWQEEHDKHLEAPGLGELEKVYGRDLRHLRRGKGDETTAGGELLDTQAIRDSDWVLTTYETLRDYQFSFAKVHFSCVVFDETQQAKNPASRKTAALKTLNAEFALALTGTPVENAMSDLWSIMDIVAPGYLGALKDFTKRYPTNDEKALAELANRLLEPQGDPNGEQLPALVLRRMKSDVAKELPEKKEILLDGLMPHKQMEQYDRVLGQVKGGGMPMLRALHDFRSISLHPVDPSSRSDGDDKAYIEDSARLIETIKILREVKELSEKALVFVSSRKMQAALAEIIETLFEMTGPVDCINGDTPQARRQPKVDEFTESQGFNVLILSPRAAGVGLNIVAATRVIHLDRWWNPAVEDQCTDRAYRIGQEKNVYVYLPLARHPGLNRKSYDFILHDLLDRKRRTAQKLFVPTEIRAGEFEQMLDEFDPSRLDGYDPIRFEGWVRDKLIEGDLQAKLTQKSGDAGADIIVRDAVGAITHIVQCKHTAYPDRPVDSGIADDLIRARLAWKAPQAILLGVTNARSFSGPVQSVARDKGIQLLGREDLNTRLTNLGV